MKRTVFTKEAKDGRLPPLDGVRALAVLLIVWYHIWQQSWLSPVLETPFLQGLGISRIDFTVLPRTGYFYVDGMLLLSGFLLFLPVCRKSDPIPSPAAFYRRRASRILPAYWLCVLCVYFLFALPKGLYGQNAPFARRDLLMTLTFTQTFRADTMLYSNINGVLWTAAVEMQFYLLFPLLCRLFRSRPALTFGGMTALGELYLWASTRLFPEKLSLLLNQLPGFFGIFAVGMGCAVLYRQLSETPAVKKPGFAGICSALFLCFAALICCTVKQAAWLGGNDIKLFQAENRLILGFLYGGLILSLLFACKGVKALLSGPVLRFIARISYPLYIWHQWIALRLKERHIPYWEGDVLPNMAGNALWQRRYTLLCFAAAIAAAALSALLFEEPLMRRLRRGKGGCKGRGRTL